MSHWMRVLRGAAGTALTWAVGWTVVGFGLSTLLLLTAGNGWAAVGQLTLVAGLSGMVGGAFFSLLIATVFSRRKLGELRVGRMAFWGAVSGLLLPAGALSYSLLSNILMRPGLVAGMMIGIGGMGAVTGGGIIKLAQRADGQLASAKPRNRIKG